MEIARTGTSVGTWDDLLPTISFCGEIRHKGLSDLSKNSWMELLSFQLHDALCISEDVVADALTSEVEEFGIYLKEKTTSVTAVEVEKEQDILADALRSALGEEEDLGIYLAEDRPDTPYSQASHWDSPSPASSTTSGVLSCHDYEALSPWSVGSPASPQVISMEGGMTSEVPQQRFTFPSYGQNTHHVQQFMQRQSVPMQMSTVDPNLANWLSHQMPTSNDPKPAKKLTRPPESYVALIAKAILSLPSGRALLSDIYNFSTDNYEYYRTAPKTWKNAIRHNLSVNECFIKNGRAPHGRGYYWSVHPACVQSFMSGDFRRREAQQLANDSDRLQQSVGYQHYYHGYTY